MCENGTSYLNAATSLHKLDPSSQSAYFLYKLNASRGNVDAALSYLEESLASTELDVKTAADYNFEAATYCVKNGRNAKALSFAEKAKELDPEYAGRAYYLIGTVWGSTSCGGDEELFISSADWMKRNLDLRIEVGAKVLDPELKARIKGIMQLQENDNRKARIIDADQKNVYVQAQEGEKQIRSQIDIHEYLVEQENAIAKELEKN